MHTACTWPVENIAHCMHLASGRQCTLHVHGQWKILHTAMHLASGKQCTLHAFKL